MKNDNHQEVVHEIANQVDKLIIDAGVRARFTEHFDRLCKMAEEYGEALHPYEQSLENIKKAIDEGKFTIPETRKRKRSDGFVEWPPMVELCPPPEGWVKINHNDNSFINVGIGVVRRPVEPVNPLLWFGIFGNASLQRKPDENEKLMCEYVRLAVIHDYEIRYSGTPTDTQIISADYKGKWFRRDEFREEVWKYYHYLYSEPNLLYQPATPQEKLSQLKRALDHVKAIHTESLQPSINAGGMDEREHKKFLLEIAKKVDKLITHIPESKSKFQQQIILFYEKRDEYCKALEQYQKAAESDHQLRDKEARPPLPLNPDEWIYDFVDSITSYMFSPTGREPDGTERLMLEYIILAIIHGEALESSKIYDGLEFWNKEWANLIWEQISHWNLKKEYDSGDEFRTEIELAFEHVKADLAPKPAETELERLRKIIKVLKNWQKSNRTEEDLQTAKQIFSPFDVTYEILNKAESQRRKTRKALEYLDMVADGKEVFCRKLLDDLSRPEVIADLEKLHEKLTKAKLSKTGEIEKEIPCEQRTPPLSLSRMAQYWGGDMTAKKVRSMVDKGLLRVIQINRQTYIFDTSLLPKHVLEKVRK